MDITRHIEYDHEKIRKYIYDMEALGKKDTALKRPLFNMLKKELLIVQKAEEDTLYHEMERRNEADALLHSLEEESETIKSLLETLSAEDPNSKDWNSGLQKLKARVFAHFDKEEHELLPKAKSALPAEKLDEEFDDEKRALWKTSTMVEKVSACEDFARTVRAA